MVIYKYTIPNLNKVSRLSMHRGATILSGGVQDDGMVIWAMVDPNESMVGRSVLVVFTGHRVDFGGYNLKYINTVTDSDGLVYHFFA